MLRTVLVSLLIAVTLPRPAEACLWDYDTLKEESLGQADVAAVVGGDLRKHSTAFYTAKVDYTRASVATGKAAKERYDDLAVALAKLGKYDEALAVLVDKDARFPNEYTTAANRGTVFAMKGDLAAALTHLNTAIAINPDAHFGREKFQLKLLDYLQRAAKDPTLATKENFLGIEIGAPDAGHSRTIIHLSRRARTRKPAPVIAALVGLIRFGDGQDSPHLWYGLGWALVDQGDAQLATRAFRRAQLLGHPRAAEDGAIVATTLPANNAICCGEPGDPKVQQAWAKLSKLADAGWAAGQATDARRQRAEDKQLARKQLKAVFGF